MPSFDDLFVSMKALVIYHFVGIAFRHSSCIGVSPFLRADHTLQAQYTCGGLRSSQERHKGLLPSSIDSKLTSQRQSPAWQPSNTKG
jgi:hypothetical protein